MSVARSRPVRDVEKGVGSFDRADAIRVYVVGDEALLLTGLRSVVDEHDDLRLVGEAPTVVDASSRLPLARPDVVIVDLDLPDGCGTDVCRFVRDELPDARCVVLAANGEDNAVAHAVRAGAHGFLTKRAPVDDVVEAVRRTAAGRPLTDQRHRQRIDELAAAGDADERLARLTQQERTLLGHVAAGLTNREIADAMGLSDKTVKNYVSSVMMKLEVAHRAAAAAYYARAEAQQPCSAHANAMSDSVIRY